MSLTFPDLPLALEIPPIDPLSILCHSWGCHLEQCHKTQTFFAFPVLLFISANHRTNTEEPVYQTNL